VARYHSMTSRPPISSGMQPINQDEAEASTSGGRAQTLPWRVLEAKQARGDAKSTAVPKRWQDALSNVEEARNELETLESALSHAIWLSVEDWQQAVPFSKYAGALQVRISLCKGECTIEQFAPSPDIGFGLGISSASH
jgi:hypothetical protein